MDKDLRYDTLKAPWRGHALVDLVNEIFNNKYDFSGGMSFETPEQMEEVCHFYDTTAPEEDKEIDKWTGFPKNLLTVSEIREKEPSFPTWDQIESRYQEYLEEYNAYEAKRKRVPLYPPVKDQLDMLFHAIDDGLLGEQAKTSDFYNTLKTIKEENQ